MYGYVIKYGSSPQFSANSFRLYRKQCINDYMEKWGNKLTWPEVRSRHKAQCIKVELIEVSK